jgi:hypothetical protein
MNFIQACKIILLDGCQWLMPVFLAAPEVEIRSIAVRSQAGQKVLIISNTKKGLAEWLKW